MTTAITLNPTDGHIIAGTALDGHRFIGRMRAAQLFQLAPDPRDTESKKRDESKDLLDLARLRDEVQRHFEGAKKANVLPYAAYIVGLADGGQDGLTPPLTLYCERALAVDERGDGTAMLQVPWDCKLVAIDGETQLAARYEAQNVDPGTAQEFVAVYICFGEPVGWARQSFHDLNTLAVRPNSAISMSMDARDPITAIANEIEQSVPFFRGRVNKHRRQLRDSDTDVMTITGLRGAIATLAKGIGGIKYGSRPVPLESGQIAAVKAAAVDWFAAVAEALGPQIEDRAASIAGSGVAMAGIGALGHGLVEIEDAGMRRDEALRLAGELRRVHWDRGNRWVGIAGKMTPKGALTVAGTKEAAYAVYGALANPDAATYASVRQAPPTGERRQQA